MAEQAIFTAIPAGRLGDGQLKVTVFVTPKLDIATMPIVDGTVELAAFDAFSNWPNFVRQARWVFDVDGFGEVEGFPIDEPIVADPELWQALFGATRVGVADFQQFEQAVVHSYPVAEVAKAVTDLYQLIAVTSPTGFPPITRGPLAGKLRELESPAEWMPDDPSVMHRVALKRYLTTKRDGSGRYLDIDTVKLADQPRFALAAAVAFYDRSDDPWSEAEATAKAPPQVPPEFHSFVSRCADYPELLRHLGLALDVWINDDPSIPEHTTIRVLDGFNDEPLESLLLQPDSARPRTYTHHTDRVWAPRAREEQPDIVDGSLALDRSDFFTIEQVDPDGAALKVTSLLETLRRTNLDLISSAKDNNNAASMTADASSLPALKSAGIVVARRNRAKGLVFQFDRGAEHEDDRNAGRPAELSGSDVTRGWRVDVQDLTSASGEWFSLHRRVGEYRLVAPDQPPQPLGVQPGSDEAYLKAASTSSRTPKPTDDQWFHETLAGWDGWSLAVKRPGRPQRETDTLPAEAEAKVAPTGFPLDVRFRPRPGSLPRLRFGRSYRLRVRAVDLSGRSIPDDQLDEAHERDLPETYQRWEPVPSPAVVPLIEYTEGESLVRMVIRSTLDVSVPDYIVLARVAQLRGHQPTGTLRIVYREDNERNLAAPIAGVQLAETHGMFDAALAGDPIAVAEQYAVAAKESGSYLTLAGGRVVNHLAPEGATVLRGDKSQTLAQGEYVVHDTHDLPLPYLPDPLARGLSFTTLPGDGAAGGSPSTRLLRWPGDPAVWHDRQPVLLRIVEGDAAPAFDEATRTLVVSLPKATLATVRVSSFLDDADPALMRIWNLIDLDQQPASPAQLETVRRGLHWMITPFSELTLVHAVEKPLEVPAIVLAPGNIRLAGETFSWLPGAVRNHAASTGRIDIDARWEDPVDDVQAPTYSFEPKHAHVADFQLETSEVDALIARTGGPAGGPYGPRHRARHEFGDTRHRYVDYTPTATTRFREYFPPEITDRAELVTSVGATLRVDVPSSARPKAPDVRYIVPTWQWTTAVLDVESPLAVRRVRSGGGLRVYLGRPWFSSGPDELLGVVLPMQPWLTWPYDIERGIHGAAEAQAVTDVWARTVLDLAGIAVAPEQSATPQLNANAAQLGRIPGTGDARLARPRARTADERFLVAAQRAVTAARDADGSLAAAAETSTAAALVSEFLPLFNQTGPEGRKFTSVWGTDPVFDTAPVAAGPYIHQFALRTAVGNTVSLAEVAGEKVTVVGHQPEFDAERRLWFCDLQVDAGSSYTPMVQLALARYQPHSVHGEEISKVVRTDFVQLLPRREATFVVTPAATAVAVSLAGPVGIPEHAADLPNLASRVNASRLVQAWVERLPEDAVSDLEWSKVDAAVSLPVRLTLAHLRNDYYDEVEWAGAVPLPARQPGDRLRIRLAEYELHRGDPMALSAMAGLFGREHRLVYTDSVDVP